ncbi:MAG: DNA/RNA non-specific endonuclease [Bryobacteraceae bacterium]|nr:DNA/RNA non-specific endonuclease [Bryobacteraceae bacterium]
MPLDLETLEAAGRRYIGREGDRLPDAPVGTVRRKNRLSRLASESLAAAIVDRPEDVSFARERVIGANDLFGMNFFTLAVAVGRAVGRVRVGRVFGTGFLISPGVMITNQHVIRSSGEAAGAAIEMDFQETNDGTFPPLQSFALDPARFFLSDRTLDFTMVAVAPRSRSGRDLTGYGFVPLIAELGKADKDDPLNIIQHPRGQPKQIAFRRNHVVDIFDDFVHYSTDTEPGSSGAPCFNDQFELVALHHSGVPQLDAAGRPVREDGDFVWVANEGIRVSSVVRRLESEILTGERAAIRRAILETAPPNPVELAQAASAAKKEDPKMSDSNSVTVTVPLTITLSLGGAAAPLPAPAVPPPAAPEPAPVPEPGEKISIDPNYSIRDGYRRDFLPGFDVPAPVMAAWLANTAVVNRRPRDGQKYLFDYFHFSIAMSKRRRLAIYTAVNIDGLRRPSIGSRSGDAWFYDPRIDKRYQVGNEAYSGNKLDRGHLVRRLDPVWGDNSTDAKKANDDTFHWTNCSPQHKDFNQGRELWAGIEDHLLNKAKRDQKRMTVFTGPIFSPYDPLYDNEGKVTPPIRIPLEFWKVAALVREDGKLSAAAFVLTQDDMIGDADDLQEAFNPGFFQVSVTEIQRKIGLDFGRLATDDAFAGGPAFERLESGEIRGGVRISALDQIAV